MADGPENSLRIISEEMERALEVVRSNGVAKMQIEMMTYLAGLMKHIPPAQLPAASWDLIRKLELLEEHSAREDEEPNLTSKWWTEAQIMRSFEAQTQLHKAVARNLRADPVYGSGHLQGEVNARLVQPTYSLVVLRAAEMVINPPAPSQPG